MYIEETLNNIEPAVIQSSVMSNNLDRKLVDFIKIVLRKQVIHSELDKSTQLYHFRSNKNRIFIFSRKHKIPLFRIASLNEIQLVTKYLEVIFYRNLSYTCRRAIFRRWRLRPHIIESYYMLLLLEYWCGGNSCLSTQIYIY